MAHHKSAIRRIKTSETSRGRNRQYRSRMRTMLKKVRTAGQKEAAEPILKETVSLLDKLVNKKILHRKTADRQKSRLTRRVNALAQ